MIKFSRTWSMPNKDTFTIKPIGEFVKKYLKESKLSVDPFARNCDWAKYTNDINPNTGAQNHTDAVEFLTSLEVNLIHPDLIILDAPYSPRQVSECYQEIGRKVTQKDTQMAGYMKKLRDAANTIIQKNGIVLSFGWNSVGMGIKRGFELEEILLVAHGGSHSDTICIAERKMK